MAGGRSGLLLLLLVLLPVLGLASCGGGPDPSGRTSWDVKNSPVPVPYPKPRPASVRAAAAQAMPAPLAAEAGMVTVARGDTLFALSRRHKSDVTAIIRANGLEPPYVLTVGQRLRIPADRVHVVQKGETGYGISRAYGVDLATLARVNGMTPPYQVNVGQRLLVPGAVAAGPVMASSAPASASAAPSSAPPSAVPSETVATDPPPGDGTQTVASLPPRPVPVAAPPLPPASGFDWPARGRILSGYGPKPHGLHNDGINIERPEGSLIKAADAGVVVYAGNDIKAYGNLVLLRHDGGWVTAYAHAQDILVSRNQTVKRGQPIARVGATGNVTEPQLHFEIRQGRRTIDPLSQLPR